MWPRHGPSARTGEAALRGRGQRHAASVATEAPADPAGGFKPRSNGVLPGFAQGSGSRGTGDPAGLPGGCAALAATPLGHDPPCPSSCQSGAAKVRCASLLAATSFALLGLSSVPGPVIHRMSRPCPLRCPSPTHFRTPPQYFPQPSHPAGLSTCTMMRRHAQGSGAPSRFSPSRLCPSATCRSAACQRKPEVFHLLGESHKGLHMLRGTGAEIVRRGRNACNHFVLHASRPLPAFVLLCLARRRGHGSSRLVMLCEMKSSLLREKVWWACMPRQTALSTLGADPHGCNHRNCCC